MPNANQLYPFATGDGANVIDAALWQAANARQTGFQAGIAESSQVNTAIRQAAFAAAMIGQFTAGYGPADVLDDGNVTEFENNFVAALGAAIQALIPAGLLYEGSDTGTQNAAQVTSVVPALTTWTAGKTILVHKMGSANSGASTLTVLGVTRDIVWPDGSDIANNQWPGNSEALFFDDGSHFQLLTFTGPNMLTMLGGGEGIQVVGNAISLFFEGLIEEDTLADGDLFAFYSLADGHHRKTTWANIVAKIIGELPPTVTPTPYVQYPGMGTGVGQQIIMVINCPNMSTPDTYGLSPGLVVSAANLVAGNSQASGQPLDPYQMQVNSVTVQPFNGYGAAGGYWVSWPGLAGTWRLDGYTEIAGFAFGFGYPFMLVWRRVA